MTNSSILKRKFNFRNIEKKKRNLTRLSITRTCTRMYKSCMLIITLVYLLFSSWNITGREVKCCDIDKVKRNVYNGWNETRGIAGVSGTGWNYELDKNGNYIFDDSQRPYETGRARNLWASFQRQPENLVVTFITLFSPALNNLQASAFFVDVAVDFTDRVFYRALPMHQQIVAN